MTAHGYDVVLSGSYRKAPERLKLEHDQLVAVGCRILSPRSLDAIRERDGFVFMRGETSSSRDRIEDSHLIAIKRARFMWLHAPDGYVGLSAALEIGFAYAEGIPVYACEAPAEKALWPFVRIAASPDAVVRQLENEFERACREPARCGDCDDLVSRCECN